MTARKDDLKKCEFCGGTGYFELLLGGSETCPTCKGTGLGKLKETQIGNS
jgi:DnaJ-class molecular chaperone